VIALRRPTGAAALRGAALALVAAALIVVLLTPDLRESFVSGSGIAQGALVAAIGLGVVLTYRGAGVVNFANATVAMWAAYVYAGLRSRGDLFLPPLPNPLALVEGVVHWFQEPDTLDLPGWPTSLSLSGPMGFPAALAVSLLFCVMLGLILHLGVFRPLRHAPMLAKIVASVGVLLLLQAMVVRRFATNAQTIKPLGFVGKDPIDLGSFTITQEQLFVAILVIAFTAALGALFRFTRFGLATRAAAENERGAVVLGFSPDWLAGVNWVLATVITGLLGIFVASINSLIDPVSMPALILPALTAALVGGFSSFGLTTLAAFVLGMLGPLITFLGANRSWFPHANGQPVPGIEELIALVVIVAVLYLRGDALPRRGAITLGRLPFSPAPSRWSRRYGGPALAALAGVAGLFWFTPAFRLALTETLIGVMICLSVVVVTGLVGQISLAQMSFAGIAAFVVSDLSAGRGWPFPLPIFAGAAVAVVAGMVIAVPALRVRGVHLAIVTMAFAVAIDELVFSNPAVNDPLYGAPVETPAWLDPNNTAGFDVLGVHVGDGTIPNPLTAIFCLGVVVVLAYAVVNLRRSSSGRQMLALRANERAAAAAGVGVRGTKMLAFAVSSGIAGIAGGVIAYRAGAASEERFVYLQSLIMFAFAYLGGISSVAGAVVGGFIVTGGLAFTFLENVMGVPEEFALLLGGLGVVVTAIRNPEGIAGTIRETRRS
jgi:branched-chain amino acid transport system permease protein